MINKLLFASILLLIPGIAFTQGVSGSPGGVSYIPPGGRPVTVTICAPDTQSQSGCDVVVPASSAQTTINSFITNCPGVQTNTFQGYISTTTLTVTSTVSGTPIITSPAQTITAAGITANTAITGGTGPTYTVNNSQTLFSAGSPGTFTGTNPSPLAPGGCKLILRSGTYNISNSIIIDRSFIDIEGEELPFWGRYLNSWIGTSTPTGAIGTAGTRIIASATGFNLIQRNLVNIPDNGELRHRGIRIANLYLIGNSYNSDAVFFSGAAGDDDVIIENLFAHRVQQGVVVTLDTGNIRNLNLQDISGPGPALSIGGGNTRVSGVVVYDVGNNCLDIAGNDIQVVGSKFGDCGSDSVYIPGNNNTFTGNAIGSGVNSAVYNAGNNNVISSNVIDYTEGGYASKVRSVAAIRGVGVGATITDNTFTPNGTEPAGVYAVDITGTSAWVVKGNQIKSGFNNASATTILLASVPTLIEGNFGDNSAFSAAGIALPTCNSGMANVTLIVSDATAPTYNGTYTSAGAVRVPIFCNGTSWATH